MPLLRQYQTPLMGIWEITEPWQEMYVSLLNKELYDDDLNKIQSEKRKQEWIAVRLLLQTFTRARTFIIYRADGAPALSDDSFNISISHTKGYAIVLLSKNNQPGIDIELRSDRAWKLREKFLNKRELETFAQICNPCATDYVTICWCAKETAYKVLGESAVDFASHLHIEPFQLSNEGILFLQETRTLQKQRFPIHYMVHETYIVTWKA